jgi:hypothetical protein
MFIFLLILKSFKLSESVEERQENVTVLFTQFKIFSNIVQNDCVSYHTSFCDIMDLFEIVSFSSFFF